MKLPDFDTEADFNAEACENCAVCGGADQPDCLMLWTGTVQLTNLCRTHAQALADYITRLLQNAGPS